VPAVLLGQIDNSLHAEISSIEGFVARMSYDVMADAMAVLLQEVGDGACIDAHASSYAFSLVFGAKRGSVDRPGRPTTHLLHDVQQGAMKMTALSKLKLVSALAEGKSPVVQRRSKLTGKIEDQIAYAKALTSGGTYAAKRVKFVQDAESGERKQVETATRVKQWWWTAANGKVMLALRYGSKPIELAKGKNAIEVGNMADLVPVLEAVKEAAHAGELDAQIEQASGALRAGFAKAK
jgi:hypothetical protein